jgi:2',3'-cyclic-nucleotide 2'-phosphodiesterase (5'-nucleotidase family)
MSVLVLFHTNDFHNHLTLSQAARLTALRRDLGTGGLLLDAGDAISAGNVTYHPGGEQILDRMSDAGYDAMTVGNREFHFTRAGFTAKLNRARFPVLCANVRSRDPQAPLPVVPCLTRTLDGGARATILGLTVPMITERMLVRRVSSCVFDDPIATASRMIPELRCNCDLLVCLTHIGLARDRELAARVPGIDLIIGGHTHALLEEGERVNDTLITQAGWGAKFLGTITVKVGKGKPEMAAKIEPL